MNFENTNVFEQLCNRTNGEQRTVLQEFLHNYDGELFVTDVEDDVSGRGEVTTPIGGVIDLLLAVDAPGVDEGKGKDNYGLSADSASDIGDLLRRSPERIAFSDRKPFGFGNTQTDNVDKDGLTAYHYCLKQALEHHVDKASNGGDGEADMVLRRKR